MKIHLTNSANRDATIIGITSPKREKTLPAKDGQLLSFKRYIASGERNLHEDLVEKFGGEIESGELTIRETKSGRLLSCGIFARWRAR